MRSTPIISSRGPKKRWPEPSGRDETVSCGSTTNLLSSASSAVAFTPARTRGSPSPILFLVVRFQLRHHRRVGKRRRIAQRLAYGDVPQQPAHDLARSDLRQIGGEQNVVRTRDGSDFPDYVLLEAVDQIGRPPLMRPFFQGDECGDRLAFDVVRPPDDRRL